MCYDSPVERNKPTKKGNEVNEVISRYELVEKIKAAKGFYSVTFVKRTTNSLRRMICRNKVQKHLAGGERKYNPVNHDLIATYSMDSKGYRTIAIEGIKSAVIDRVTYVVE